MAHDGTVAAVTYAAPWDALVTRLKFHAALDLAPVMARMLAQAVGQTPPLAPVPEVVVPVAMTASRLAERGYNQAWQIARRVAQDMGLPAFPHVLQRQHQSASQVKRTRTERLSALRGAFATSPDAAEHLAGRHLALVDDVMTSGATAHAATLALKAAGAATVTVWVFARTPDNRG